MQPEQLAVAPHAENGRWRIGIIALAVFAYLLNLVGVAWTTFAGDLLSSIALLVLGIAVSRLTWLHLAAMPQWPGKRLPIQWRRMRILAVSTAVAIYLALVFGSLVTNMGGAVSLSDLAFLCPSREWVDPCPCTPWWCSRSDDLGAGVGHVDVAHSPGTEHPTQRPLGDWVNYCPEYCWFIDGAGRQW